MMSTGNQIYQSSLPDTQHKENCKNLYAIVKNFCISHNWYFCQRLPVDLDQIQTDKVFFFWIGDMPALEDWIEFDKKLTLRSKRAIAIVDSFFDSTQFASLHLISCPELLGLYSVYKPSANTCNYVPTKLFHCFMQRVESVRQSWFYFLHLYNLIDKGYVSFLLYQLNSYSPATGQQLFEQIHYQHELHKLPHFDRAYHDLKSKVPFRNFIELCDLDHLIMDSKYSLVLEGEGPDDDQRFCTFTEKILRALQYPCYHVFFVQRNGISKLQQLGLEINLDLTAIDRLSWQQRQQELLNFLVHDPLSIDSQCQIDIANHNQNLLSSWYNKVMSPNYFDQFFTKALEL